jgi:hypothetical protein
MLNIKDFYPIDRNLVKKKWHEIMNIPNNEWERLDVDRNIDIINNPSYPMTLRLVQLNLLPALIIEILRNDKLKTS